MLNYGPNDRPLYRRPSVGALKLRVGRPTPVIALNGVLPLCYLISALLTGTHPVVPRCRTRRIKYVGI